SSRGTLRLPRLDSRHTQSARCGRDRDCRFENLSSIHAVPPKCFGTSIDDALNSDNYQGCNERRSSPSLTVCAEAANLRDPPPETLAFLGRQARPAVTGSITSGWHDHAKPTKASEQDPAQTHQTDGLPEVQGMQAEQVWHQPVPKLQHRLTESRDDNQDQHRESEHSRDDSLCSFPAHHCLRSGLPTSS